MRRIPFIACIIFCLGNCSCKTTSSGTQEPRVLAQSNSSFTLDRATPFYQVLLTPERSRSFSANDNIKLVFTQPRMVTAPEGVLEVYVTRQPVAPGDLQPENPGFINVLDLFSLGTTSENLLELDVSVMLRQLLPDNVIYPPLYVSVLFRGNKMKSGAESKNAGSVSFKSMRLELADL